MPATRTRNPALDLTRCAAFFSVVFVHFFRNVGVFEETVQGPLMYFLILLRTGALVCVPLFLMLSGWLMAGKRPSARYFRNIGKILVIYLLASIFCGFVSAVNIVFIRREPLSLASLILGIFDYSTAPYAWYVEMYIGLYFLIPFLNILWQGLPGKQEKQWLLLILLCLTALPSVVNVYGPGQLIPEWWASLYPVSYYYLGTYLKEYPLTFSRKTKLLLYGMSVLAAGSYNFFMCLGERFLWGPWQDWGSVLVVIQAALLFDLLARTNLSGLGEKSKTWLARMSDWCFGAYLVSWAFDMVFYLAVNRLVFTLGQKVPFVLITVPGVFLCSLCTSAVLNWFYRTLRKVLIRQKTA